MAIRPTDLQSSIVQSVQNPPLDQRVAEAPRQAQIAAQAAFVARTEERNESVVETGNLRGNQIEVGERQAGRKQPQGRRRKREPGEPFDDVVDEAAGLDEPPHLIDFTA